MPLHRPREYNREARTLEKFINHATWYTDVKIGDPFKHTWKKWVKRKSNGNKIKGGNLNNSPVTTTLFVPKTVNGNLMEM